MSQVEDNSRRTNPPDFISGKAGGDALADASGDTSGGGPGNGFPMRPVWLVAIGDELLLGRTVDSNSQAIQRALSSYGVVVQNITVVSDDADAVAAALAATAPGGLVFLSGGLGSTPDDLTRQSVAAWAGVALIPHPTVRAQLEERCRQRGLPPGDWIEPQTLVPAGLVPLPNCIGTAPALVGRLAERTLVILPGVPSELRGLLPDAISWLEQEGCLPPSQPTLLYRTAQMAETNLVKLCQPVMETFPGLGWSWWLVRWGVDIQVTIPVARADPVNLPALANALQGQLGVRVYATDRRELTEVIQELLVDKGQSLCVAESCTAGLLAARLTEVAGSSAFFRGGIVAYADDVKHDLLDVPSEILSAEGAVSRPTALAMARAAQERFGTDYALAITGIAGPEGGSGDKPVGTTWIALATPRNAYACLYRFPGTRQRNRQLAVAAALDSLRRILQYGEERPPWHPDDSWGRTA